MLVKTKHKATALRLVALILVVIGLTATLAACKQPVLTSISSGLTQACGLKQDGTPVCWDVGQLGYTRESALNGEDVPPEGEKFTSLDDRGTPRMRPETGWDRPLLGKELPAVRQPRRLTQSSQKSAREYRSYLRPERQRYCSLLGKRRTRPTRSARGREVQDNQQRLLAHLRPQGGRIDRLLGRRPLGTIHSP